MAEAQLFSKLNNIESEIEHISCNGGATSIAVSVSAIENIQPILDAISVAETQLFSKLNIIESEIEHISCNGGATSIAVNISAIENIQPILSAISQSEAITFSQLSNVSSVLGQTTDIGTCLDGIIANMPNDINNFQLNVIQLLKTILLELRGCCAVGT